MKRLQLLLGMLIILFLLSNEIQAQVQTLPSIPGKIESEAFNAMYGVQIETSNDLSGISNVGYIDTDDWVEYSIYATKSTAYDFTFRTASLANGGKVILQIDGVTVSGEVSLPITGGWHTWANTLLKSVPLTQGNHTLKVLFVDGAFNLDYINVSEHVNRISGYLRTSGKNIINNEGNFQIQAVNIGNYMVQEGYMLNLGSGYQHVLKQKIADVVGTVNMENFYEDYITNFLTKADVDSIAKWGFNTIRLPMHYNLFTQQGNPNVFIEKGFAKVDQIVSWCKANNIYLILDLHAAPGGQNSGDISDYVEGQSSLWEDVPGSTYTSAQNRAVTIALWKEFARRYANEETIGGYDLLNETNWTIPNNTLLLNLMKDITAAIRTVDNNHILYIEGNSYANDYTGLTPKWDNNMVYSFHKYWNDVTDGSLNFIFYIRDSQNVPIWLGEFGENSNHWIRETIELMNKYNIGWAIWPYKKMVSVSGAVAFKEPENWQAMGAYFKGGAKPSAEVGQAVLNEMVENVKLSNCSINHGYLFSLFSKNVNETKPFHSVTLPAKIQAAHYDEGKNGMTYSDVIYQTTQYGSGGGNYTAWNTGWYLRNDGVDIQYSSSENAAIVGWAEDDEWMNYTINAIGTKNYNLKVRVAGMGGKITVMIDGTTRIDNASIPSTGDWDTWTTVDLGSVSITSGAHLIKVIISESGYNLNYLDFSEVCVASISALNTSICPGGNVLLTANNGSSYKWFNGTTQVGTSQTYTAIAAGSYTVEVTHASNCKAISPITVITMNTLPTAMITAASPTTFCMGGSVLLTASPGSGYKWFNGTNQVGSSQTYTAAAAGSYTVEITNASNCKAISPSTVVTVHALPIATITASGPTNIIQGRSVILTANTGSGLSYKWFKGSSQVAIGDSYTAISAGTYKVEVKNSAGCSAVSGVITVNVNANQHSQITITSPTNNSTLQGTITITASISDPDGTIALVEYLDGNSVIGTSLTPPYSFLWDNPGEGNHVITVRVTDSNGGITTSAPVTITFQATTTGLYSNNSNALNGVIYPNPTNGILFIDSQTNLSGASFTILDVLGKEAAVSSTPNGQGARIDLTNLNAGTYVIVIKVGNSILRDKITIMK